MQRCRPRGALRRRVTERSPGCSEASPGNRCSLIPGALRRRVIETHAVLESPVSITLPRRALRSLSPHSQGSPSAHPGLRSVTLLQRAPRQTLSPIGLVVSISESPHHVSQFRKQSRNHKRHPPSCSSASLLINSISNIARFSLIFSLGVTRHIQPLAYLNRALRYSPFARVTASGSTSARGDSSSTMIQPS